MNTNLAVLATKLTDKQRRFVEEYLVDANATQAAIRAGYSPRNAKQIGSELLDETRRPHVAAAIRAKQTARAERVGVTADEVVADLKALAFSDIGDVLDFSGDVLCIKPLSQIQAAARRAIASIKVKRCVEGSKEDPQVVELVEFKLWDKVAALRELALHLPGFRAPSKIEIEDPRAELAKLLGIPKEELPGAE